MKFAAEERGKALVEVGILGDDLPELKDLRAHRDVKQIGNREAIGQGVLGAGRGRWEGEKGGRAGRFTEPGSPLLTTIRLTPQIDSFTSPSLHTHGSTGSGSPCISYG